MIFRGGLPYGPEMHRLDDAFPLSALNEGRIVKHAELEGVLGVKRGSARYYGVIHAWMARQRNNNNVFLAWEPTIGLKVLDPGQVLDFAEGRTRQKIRQVGRAIRTFGYVDRARLDKTGQARLDHQLMVTGRIKTAMDSAKKELAVELAPVKSLPKRVAS